LEKISVLLVEDHEVVRKGLKNLIEEEDLIEVVGEAEDGARAVKKARELDPDMVVMDISMPNLNGLEATRRILKGDPETKVLILTVHSDKEYIFRVLKAGASGYILKKAAPEELITAIRTIHGGEVYLSPSVSTKVVNQFTNDMGEPRTEDLYEELTNREREVLQLIAEGNSTSDIADTLSISTNTVSTHRRHIMEKLDLYSVAELTQFAILHGIIDPQQL